MVIVHTNNKRNIKDPQYMPTGDRRKAHPKGQ